jgi:2-oxoisovalerate dehydrogenase E1 component
MTLLIETLDSLPRLKRLCAEDSFIALGPSATATLPSRSSIRQAALELVAGSDARRSSP